MRFTLAGHLEIVKRLIGAGSGSLRMNVNSEFKVRYADRGTDYNRA